MRPVYLLLAAITLLCSGCATRAQEGCIDIAYTAMGKGQYQKAISNLTAAEWVKKPTPALHAEILFLHARSDEGQKIFHNAKKHYRNVIKNFPDSIYAFMAAELLKRLESDQTTEAPPLTLTPADKAPEL